jgi:integrase
VGENPDGTPIKKDFYGINKKDAETQYRDYVNENMNHHEKANMVLIRLLKPWVYDMLRVQCKKHTTFVRYEGIYRKLLENSSLASYQLKRIGTLEIQKFYTDLDEKNESLSSIKLVRVILRGFFEYAKDQRWVSHNPCVGARLPIKKVQKSTIFDEDQDLIYFTSEELTILLDGAKHHRLYPLIALAVGSGLRKGELLGLEHQDIDFNEHTVSVKRTIATTYIIDSEGNREYLTMPTEPKSTCSYRKAQFPKSVIPLLKMLRKRQLLERNAAGSSYIANNYVFTNEMGGLYNSSNISSSWKSLLKKLGLEHKKFHALRHTFATQLFANNVPIEIVSKMLGHASVDVTRDIYIHILPESKTATIEILDALFSGSKKELAGK